MNIKMRQLIIARKDLNMSPGKLAAQCCHALLAFITRPMRDAGFGTFHRGDTLRIPVAIEEDTYKKSMTF